MPLYDTIDTYLAARLVGRDDPWLRKTLASKVQKLAEAVRNAKFSNPIANEVEERVLRDIGDDRDFGCQLCRHSRRLNNPGC
jgi:hypothetical protein